jgi:hypothetical protein
MLSRFSAHSRIWTLRAKFERCSECVAALNRSRSGSLARATEEARRGDQTQRVSILPTSDPARLMAMAATTPRNQRC